MGDVNVRVALRCRPLSSSENARGAKVCVVIDDTSVIVTAPDDTATHGEPKQRDFVFDKAYSMTSTQLQVYEDLGKPIIEKALEGYNGTIFAYGQTGSGKTHSMMGSGADIGLIPQMIQQLFRNLDETMSKPDLNIKFLVTVSYLEIYNEVVKDLLNPSDKHLKIREHPDLGIYVEGLAELVSKNAEEVLKLIDQGNSVRQVAATQMNERSSRSHSCFTIKIGQKKTEILGEVARETSTEAKINLVDLAGSERASKTGATGDRLKEGAAINKSLSALGNVINMLADPKRKSQHVPYRDSKLTRLLQESLGGNALTVMIAAISPADYNYEETISTLQYASRAKAITNTTKKNEGVNEKIIRELREEIEKLRQIVAQGGTARSKDEGLDREAMKKMEEMIANLERAKHQSWEEKEKLAKLYEDERQKNLGSDGKILAAMETVKDEKIAIMKKIRKLEQHKAKISKALQHKKDSMTDLKAELGEDIKRYKDLEGKEDAASQEKGQALLSAIERRQADYMKEKEELGILKEKLGQIDDRLAELDAELAATTAILMEQNDLRKAIEDDERKKIQAAKEDYLKTFLEEERKKLQEETERQRAELELKYAQEGTARERQLELELLKERAQNKALSLELEERDDRIQRLNNQFREILDKTKHEAQDLVSELESSFEEERQCLMEQLQEAQSLLRAALEDLQLVSRENEDLEIRLKAAYYWEPPAIK